ncbi:MAG: EpsG family protein [Lachnospiraceae bacterium]
MIWYLGLTVITVMLAGFVTRPLKNVSYTTRTQLTNRVILFAIFVLLFMISAGRYYVGNDYGEYIAIFKRVGLGQSVSSEFGFNTVVRIVQFLCGKESFIPIFAIFSFFTVFFLLKAVYEQSDWFAYGFFLLMASGYYFSGLNTVRYYLALAMALYAAKYMIRKDYARFLLWILLAATFHKTVLVVIPIYWFASRQWKKREVTVILAFCASLLLFQDFYRKIIFAIYPWYEDSRFNTGETSYINIVKGICVLVFALLYYKEAIRDDKRNQFYFYLNIGAILLYLFASFIPVVSRIGYYLNATQIFLIPNILVKIPKKKERIFFGILIALAFLLYFAVFLHKAGAVDLRIIPYKTWIF